MLRPCCSQRRLAVNRQCQACRLISADDLDMVPGVGTPACDVAMKGDKVIAQS